MTNETGKNVEQKQPNSTDQYKKNPSHESGQHLPNQQDPSKKTPSQGDDSRPGNEPGSGHVEKRRA